MVTVLFTDGKEKQYDAEAASKDGPLFVLRKYNRKRRKSDICETFPVGQVVWAQFPGSIILGGGRIESSEPKG
jgi:hypothetical protein